MANLQIGYFYVWPGKILSKEDSILYEAKYADNLEIVPVTPTALERKVGFSVDQSTSMSSNLPLSAVTNWIFYLTVQTWTSILLALYSAALLAFSRESIRSSGVCEL